LLEETQQSIELPSICLSAQLILYSTALCHRNTGGDSKENLREYYSTTAKEQEENSKERQKNWENLWEHCSTTAEETGRDLDMN
jgi:hypothetical protein